MSLTCQTVPVQLDEVTENVFGEAFFIRQTLKKHHHLHLAQSMHSLCCHTPAFPVYIWAGNHSWAPLAGWKRTASSVFRINVSFMLHIKAAEINWKAKVRTVDQVDHSEQVSIENEHHRFAPGALQLLDEQHLRGLLVHSVICRRGKIISFKLLNLNLNCCHWLKEAASIVSFSFIYNLWLSQCSPAVGSILGLCLKKYVQK